MGQTLTHGVYLPDEGERNCYAGLAANWQLLDNSVGTVAEHTSALAGKAPLVHTHTKSDITDLFNSANTWTGNNVYSDNSLPTLKFKNTSLDISSLPASNLGIHIEYLDKNNVVVGGWNYIKGPDGTTRAYIELTTKDSNNQEIRRTLRLDTDQNGANWQFYPSEDTNLGISTNQWNNLYAKNYYYNGVAWGLDKANEWIGTNIFASVLRQRINSVYSQTPDTDRFAVHEFVGTDNKRIFNLNCADRSSGQREISLMVYDTDGTFQTSGLYKESDSSYSFKPRNTNVVNLGTSTNKWKSLNGINPGALSLPDYNNVLDVTSEIPIASLDGNTQIDINTYLPNKTGWLSIVIADAAGNSIVATQGRPGGSTAYNNSRTFHTGAQSNGYISLFFPILANMNKFVMIKASSLIQMKFYYCLGNV